MMFLLNNIHYNYSNNIKIGLQQILRLRNCNYRMVPKITNIKCNSNLCNIEKIYIKIMKTNSNKVNHNPDFFISTQNFFYQDKNVNFILPIEKFINNYFNIYSDLNNINQNRSYSTSTNTNSMLNYKKENKKSNSDSTFNMMDIDVDNTYMSDTSDYSANTCSESDYSPKNSNYTNNNQIDLKILTKMYLNPKFTLHNFYSILSKDLNNKNLNVRPQYVYVRKVLDNAPCWQCNYNLKWPEIKKISSLSSTKKDASHNAALLCLQWLHQMQKIIKGVPILTGTTAEAQLNMKQTAMNKLYLNEESMENIQNIIQEYNENFDGKFSLNHETASDNVSEQPYNFFNVTPKFIKPSNYIAKEKVELPIFKYKHHFMNILNENNVIIIKGEPGCGKSTRIPQYVMENWLKETQLQGENCRIVVTQPRRIAAISLANMVAKERDENVGQLIGYHVRLKSQFRPDIGKILYCTTGILLRHIQSDPELKYFSHVILDEVHERDVNTDLLLNLLKNTIKNNSKLKLIIMSATLNTEMYQNYFNQPAVIHIPGFTYPVKENFLDDINLNLSKTQKMLHTSPCVAHNDICTLIQYVHKNRPEGAILCFLPGWDDIIKVDALLRAQKPQDISIICLHSRLEDTDQHKIFSNPPPGVRKVILSTNIAETSITINDVVYVIDSGIHKETRFDYEKGVNCIDNFWISKSSMKQRKGRAGRVKPGESFHLYTKDKYEKFNEFSLPEILRTSLTKIVLDLKVYTNNLKAMEFMEQLPSPPDTSAINKAVQELKELELLDNNENLTPLGKTLSGFQLEPKVAKVLVNSVFYKCVTPIVDIVTLFSDDTKLFSTDLTNKEQMKIIKSKYSNNSDHLSVMRMFEKWMDFIDSGNIYEANNFSNQTNLINHRLFTFQKLRHIHYEYLCNLFDILPISDDYSDNDELVKAVLLSGVGTLLNYRNWDVLKGRIKKANILLTNNNLKATITPESVNYKKGSFSPNFLVYVNETRSNIRRTTLVRECSVIPPLTIKNTSNLNDVVIGLMNTKIEMLCDKMCATQLIKCKESIDSVYNYFIYQMTKGGHCDKTAVKIWEKMLNNLNELLLKNTV